MILAPLVADAVATMAAIASLVDCFTLTAKGRASQPRQAKCEYMLQIWAYIHIMGIYSHYGYIFTFPRCEYMMHPRFSWVRPHLAESTTSRPICEVKQPQAALVLRSVMTWEPAVSYSKKHFFF